MKEKLAEWFREERRPLWYSVGAHLSLVLLIVILSYHNIKIFTFGNAGQSQQQVQIVNATLVLPPSMSKVVTSNPPAPAPPTPPTKTPSKEISPRPAPKPNPKPDKPTPQKLTQDKNATVVEKKQEQKKSSSSIQNKQVLQNLKALGLSSIKQAVDTNQKEDAGAAQASANLTLKEKYMGLIQQTIRSNWINQFDPAANLTVVLKISLDKTGNVLSVTVSQSSGNAAFDRQAVLAVKKSSPLPLPPDPSMAKDFMNIILPFSNQIS